MKIYAWGVLLAILASCGSMYTPGQVKTAASEARLTMPDPRTKESVEGFWEVEPGVQLAHFAQGKGRPILVVPGGPGMPPSAPWPSLKALGEDYQFVYYHPRGSGRSTRPVDRFEGKDFYANMVSLEAKLGMAVQIADIERIRRILGQDKLILLGHSYGGVVALLYAVEFPEHVEKLILAAPAQLLFLPQPQGEGLYDAVADRLDPQTRVNYDLWRKELFNFAAVFGQDEARLTARNNAFVPFWSQASLRLSPQWGDHEVFDPSLTGGWIQPALAFSLGSTYDLRSAVGKVTAPILLVAGDQDLAAPASSMNQYARVLPQARVATLPGGGHFLSQAPAILASTIREFLSKEQP